MNKSLWHLASVVAVLARPLPAHLADQVIALLLVRSLTRRNFSLLRSPSTHLAPNCRVTQPFNPFHCDRRPPLISRSDSRKDLLSDMVRNIEHSALQDDLRRIRSLHVGSSLDHRYISLRRGDNACWRCWEIGRIVNRLLSLSPPTSSRGHSSRDPLCLQPCQRFAPDALQTYQDLRTVLVCLQCKEVLEIGDHG